MNLGNKKAWDLMSNVDSNSDVFFFCCLINQSDCSHLRTFPCLKSRSVGVFPRAASAVVLDEGVLGFLLAHLNVDLNWRVAWNTRQRKRQKGKLQISSKTARICLLWAAAPTKHWGRRWLERPHWRALSVQSCGLSCIPAAAEQALLQTPVKHQQKVTTCKTAFS